MNGTLSAVKHKNLLFAAVADLERREVRSVVVAVCLAAILLPLFTAVAISEGIKFQAEVAVTEGADLYVSSDLFGGEGPVSLAAVRELYSVQGVDRATERVVGRTYFVDRLVSVIGLTPESLMELRPLVNGNIPREEGQVILGESVAEEFGVEPGVRFTLAANNTKVFRRAGTLLPTCLWGSDIIVMSMEDANEFFRTQGLATQVLLYGSAVDAKSGDTAAAIREEVERRSRTKTTDRRDAWEKLQAGFDRTGGIFLVLLITGLALAIPAFLVTSGLGLRELDKEIGVMKSIGWKTHDVLEKLFLENLLISVTAVSLSLLVSAVWTKVLNGLLVAQFFVSEVGLVPDMDIPSRYLVSHALYALCFALGLTLVGSLPWAWIKLLRAPTRLMR